MRGVGKGSVVGWIKQATLRGFESGLAYEREV